jgi:HlyD family secretion protein
MTATATIKTAQVHDALLVPNAALRFTPAVDSSALATNPATARGGTSTHQVWILRQGVPSAIAVKIGLSDGQFTQVTGGDIASDTPVITGVLEGAAAVGDSTRPRAPAGMPGLPRAR